MTDPQVKEFLLTGGFRIVGQSGTIDALAPRTVAKARWERACRPTRGEQLRRVILFIAALLSLLVTPAAGAALAPDQGYNEPFITAERQGNSNVFIIRGGGCAPGSPVDLVARDENGTPVETANGTADANGEFEILINLSQQEPGTYLITATCGDLVQSVEVEVRRGGGGPPPRGGGGNTVEDESAGGDGESGARTPANPSSAQQGLSATPLGENHLLVSGSGCNANEAVTIEAYPISLVETLRAQAGDPVFTTTTVADATGVFSVELDLNHLPPGRYLLRCACGELVQTLEIEVLGDAVTGLSNRASGPLAFTGFDSMTLTKFALVALAAGAVAVHFARRRRARTARAWRT